MCAAPRDETVAAAAAPMAILLLPVVGGMGAGGSCAAGSHQCSYHAGTARLANRTHTMKIEGKLQPPVGPQDHYLGPADAPVVLVEYGDYECPHCGRAHAVVQHVLDRLGDRVRYVFRNFL